MLIEHDITDVCVEMYVIEIIEPKDTFSLTKIGLLKNERVIEALRQKSVTKRLIETSKTQLIEPQSSNKYQQRHHHSTPRSLD
jgi:hypothetical protein